MDRKYDFIVLGASGFTGQKVVEQLLVSAKHLGRRTYFSWAVAGRSKPKLDKAVSKAISNAMDVLYPGQVPTSCIAPEPIDILEVDIKSPTILRSVVKQARIILNCTGPYLYLGEVIVQACIDERTHYIDLSGEPLFSEKIQNDYHDEAKDKGVYVLSSCGVGSLPTEVAINFLQDKYNGDMNSVEVFLDLPRGPFHISQGTWNSVVLSISRQPELESLRRQQLETEVPEVAPKLSKKWFQYNSRLKAGAFPDHSAITATVRQTQNYLYQHEKKRPVQIETYSTIRKWGKFFRYLYMLVALLLLSKFRIGRFLLHQFPRAWTAGLLIRPRRIKKLKPNPFSQLLVSEGWSSPLNPRTPIAPAVAVKPPDLRISVSIQHMHTYLSVYDVSALCMAQAAITLLREEHNFLIRGGVYTPGVAFRKTSLLTRLQEFGLQFNVVESRSLAP